MLYYWKLFAKLLGGLLMAEKLFGLILEITDAKRKLQELYDSKGYTDYEVLKQGDKVDRLINQYLRMVNQKAS
jgi:hypothetical protein